MGWIPYPQQACRKLTRTQQQATIRWTNTAPPWWTNWEIPRLHSMRRTLETYHILMIHNYHVASLEHTHRTQTVVWIADCWILYKPKWLWNCFEAGTYGHTISWQTDENKQCAVDDSRVRWKTILVTYKHVHTSTYWDEASGLYKNTEWAHRPKVDENI